ncbi:unnamed protein product, partial [Candidula unifasciata]
MNVFKCLTRHLDLSTAAHSRSSTVSTSGKFQKKIAGQRTFGSKHSSAGNAYPVAILNQCKTCILWFATDQSDLFG